MRLAVLALIAACAAPAASPPARWVERSHPAPAAAPAALFPATGPFRLDHAFEPARYRVSLSLEEHAFTGHVEIDGTLSEQRALIWLHGAGLVVTRAVARQGSREVALIASEPREDQLLGLYAKPPLAPGAWTIAIDYRGTIQEQRPPRPAPFGPPQDPPGTGLFRRVVGASSYFFTQSEAIYARRIFPCIDEPDRKVPWQLTLEVPAALLAASNTPIVRETPLGHGRKRVEFAQTKPLPSYLVAFAVGPFDVVDAGKTNSGVPVRILVMKGETGQAATAAAVTPKLLDALEAWTEIPYEYGKLDLVMVPHTSLAMENPGLITMEQDWFSADIASGIITHELAHQWFGDLVTPRWWDDIWLNEGFATWMAQKIGRQLDGTSTDPIELHHFDLEELDPRGPPLRARLDSSRALELPEFPGGDVDQRGAAVLDLLEGRLGPEPLRQSLHAYLAAHANGLVSTSDLVAALDQHSSQPLDGLIAELLDHGLPLLEAELDCEHGVKVQVFVDSPGIPVCLAYDRDGARAETCATVGPGSPDVPLAATACPRWVLPDPGGLGPYHVDWTDALVHDLLAHGWSALTHDERRSIFDELDDEVLKVQVLAKLEASHDPPPLVIEARFLARTAKLVPADLRARFVAWADTRFGALARGAQLSANPRGSKGSAQIVAVELLSILGDAGLARTAKPLAASTRAGQLRSHFSFSILVLAADTDPAFADSLLDEVVTDGTFQHLGALHALSFTSQLGRFAKLEVDKLARLGSPRLRTLFENTCDPAVRSVLAALAAHHPASEGFGDALAEVDDCLRAQAKLAPYFRAWLAPPARSSAP